MASAFSGWWNAWRGTDVGMDIAMVGCGKPEDVAMRQERRLVALLQAAQASPFYRELHGALPANAAEPGCSLAHLATLPVACKSALMQRFADWVTDPALDLAQLRAFVADPARIGEAWQGRYTVWESSGTSGEPAIFVQDAQAMAVYDSLEALRRSSPRPLQRWLDPLLLTERMAFVGAIEGHFASQVSLQRLRRLNPWGTGSLRSFSILQPVDALVDALNAFQPTIIATYPTAAAMLAQQSALGRLRISLAELWTGGETLSAATRKVAAAAFGCPVRNSFGASEFFTIGWECAHGQLHANADWVILEPVDEQYRPVPPGVMSHTTLLTNLANHVQPLIRYDLGDQVRMQPERCACGSPLPVIEVLGRRDDVLVLPGVNGQPVTLLPLALTTVLEEEAGVFDFQLCQHGPDRLVLGLGSAEPEARCRQVLLDYCRHMGAQAPSLLIETAGTLAHGRSGKLQRIRCESSG